MKKALWVLLIFCAGLSIHQAHANDSLNFVKAKWKVEKVSKGVKLYTFHFNQENLFQSNQYISYVVFNNKRNGRKAGIGADPKLLKTTSNFATASNADVAVNGNFFDMRNGGAVAYTKKDGIVINTNKITGNQRAFHQKAAVVIEDGRLQIKNWDGSDNWEAKLTESDVMLTGPLLIFNSASEKLDSSSSFTITRHPRTCVGTTRSGNVIMLIADGRNANARGMNLFELANVMKWLGSENAVNLDGGGSSALWVKGRGVVNHPSDNGKWNHEGERKVANILLVKPRK